MMWHEQKLCQPRSIHPATTENRKKNNSFTNLIQKKKTYKIYKIDNPVAPVYLGSKESSTFFKHLLLYILFMKLQLILLPRV